MWQNAHDTYLENRVLSAGPIELVRLLCHGATGAVKDARTHLAAGDIAARARSITKASNILIELASSLDHQRGGEISTNLARLYDYMLRQLADAISVRATRRWQKSSTFWPLCRKGGTA